MLVLNPSVINIMNRVFTLVLILGGGTLMAVPTKITRKLFRIFMFILGLDLFGTGILWLLVMIRMIVF